MSRTAPRNDLTYLTGFGNGFETEALPGALPIGRNSPQNCAYGLYAEQISGSPFTAPRATNERSWLYRIRPTVKHWGRFTKADARFWRTAPLREIDLPPAPMRWNPIPLPSEPLSFIEGIRTITTAGDAGAQAGMAAHVYLATRSMIDEYFYNADGELLVVPQSGSLRFATEFGLIDIEPGEVAVIPRGVKFRVELKDGPTRPAQVTAIAPPALWPRDPPVRFRKTVADSWLRLTIHEGRNRQVRRMTAAVGYPTLRLVRWSIGDWTIDGLAPGEWREVQV